MCGKFTCNSSFSQKSLLLITLWNNICLLLQFVILLNSSKYFIQLTSSFEASADMVSETPSTCITNEVSVPSPVSAFGSAIPVKEKYAFTDVEWFSSKPHRELLS